MADVNGILEVQMRDQRRDVGGARRPKPVRHGAQKNVVQKERQDRRARKNRRDKKER